MLNDSELAAVLEVIEEELEKKLRPLVDKYWTESTADIDHRTDLAADLATAHLGDPAIKGYSKNEAKGGAEMAFALSAVDHTTRQTTQDFMAEYTEFVTKATDMAGIMVRSILQRLIAEKATEFIGSRN